MTLKHVIAYLRTMAVLCEDVHTAMSSLVSTYPYQGAEAVMVRC